MVKGQWRIQKKSWGAELFLAQVVGAYLYSRAKRARNWLFTHDETSKKFPQLRSLGEAKSPLCPLGFAPYTYSRERSERENFFGNDGFETETVSAPTRPISWGEGQNIPCAPNILGDVTAVGASVKSAPYLDNQGAILGTAHLQEIVEVTFGVSLWLGHRMYNVYLFSRAKRARNFSLYA